jgi:hypothetical protein
MGEAARPASRSRPHPPCCQPPTSPPAMLPAAPYPSHHAASRPATGSTSGRPPRSACCNPQAARRSGSPYPIVNILFTDFSPAPVVLFFRSFFGEDYFTIILKDGITR